MSLTKVSFSMIQGAPVSALDLVTGGAGTTASPWTGWEPNIDWTVSGIQYAFPKGVYSFSNPIVISSTTADVSFVGVGQAELVYTGTTVVAGINNAITVLGENFCAENILIRGNATATTGIHIGSLISAAGHGCIRNVRFADFTHSGIRTFFSITGLLDSIVVSQNDGYLFSFLPPYGIYLDGDNTHQTTTQTIINPIMEGCSIAGIYLGNAIINTIIGGVSEANGKGIWFSVGAGSNRVFGIDLEANTLDLQIDAATNDLFGVSAATTLVNGTFNKFYGGRLITVTNAGNYNEYYGVYSVTFVDGATRTARYNSEMLWAAYTPTITPDAGTIGTPTINVARWKLIGNNLYLEYNISAAVTSGSPLALSVSLPSATYACQATSSAAYTPAFLQIGSAGECGWLRPIGGSSNVNFYRQQFNALTGTVTFGGIFVIEIQ